MESTGLEGNQECLGMARLLIAHMEAGNTEQADRVLNELTRMREYVLFQELGKLTREFHESLNSFRGDARIAQLAGEEIPETKERLKHVITLTEEAAGKTLTVVEDAVPLCDLLGQRARDINHAWQRFTRREMEAEEFRDLSKELGGFFQELDAGMAELKSGLTEVLMAQDYQDLTGQIINRVISLVSDLENNLVNLIRISGQDMSSTKEAKNNDKNKLEGPQIPTIKQDDAVSGQDEVDELLSSLGF